MSENKALTTQTQNVPLTIKTLFAKDDVKKKFEEMMGKRATQFITSVLQIVNSSDLLKNAEPMSVYNTAAIAATLDLPLNNNMGFAYIVPYKDKTGKIVAQFQMGYKGFKQLAIRSGQFLLMNESDVREGEIKNHNRLTGEMEFEWIQDTNKRLSKKVVGYVSYFKLINGFEHTLYMTVEELEAHGKRFSQTYRKGFGLWKDDFPGMCIKTVVKLNLSKNAPLSVDMQKAVVADQSVIKDHETVDVDHVDMTEGREKTELDLAYDKIIDAIDSYNGVDKADIVDDCKNAQLNDEFDMEFANSIAKKLGITL